MAVYVVSSTGEWIEIGRFPLNVRTRIGLDEGRVKPSADMSSNGQLDQGLARGDAPPDRRTYQDLTFRFGIDTRFERNDWRVTTQANAISVTQETARLRWYDMQSDAPAIDLSDYRVQLERGPAHLALGNVTAGSNRHLLAGFGSRGMSGGVQFDTVAAVEAAFVSGTSVVGWSNPLGMTESSNRISSLTLALELMPRRPGGLHVDVSALNGSVLPFSSFNQGAATDAEESSGIGVQIALSDAAQRIRFAGGVSRSRFDNPADPLLSSGTTIVEATGTTRTARFGELGVQLLQNVAISPSTFANLAATIRHERIDPLYRSVGASLQSDFESNGLDVSGSLGPLSLTGGLSGARDNLADIPSILTTRTRGRSINAVLPLAALVGASPGEWWWPNMSASWQRVRQFGEDVPANGGFSESHVPDQASTSKSAGLDWMRGVWNVSYAFNQSHQDNRQPGREEADFSMTVHAVRLGLMPAARMSTSLDLSAERQKYFEFDTTQRLRRLGGSAQLQLLRATSMSAAVSRSWGFDPFAEHRTRNTEFNVELAQGFTAYGRHDGGTQGRVFIRYARTRAAIRPFDTLSILAPRFMWTLNAGASFRLY